MSNEARKVTRENLERQFLNATTAYDLRLAKHLYTELRAGIEVKHD